MCIAKFLLSYQIPTMDYSCILKGFSSVVAHSYKTCWQRYFTTNGLQAHQTACGGWAFSYSPHLLRIQGHYLSFWRHCCFFHLSSVYSACWSLLQKFDSGCLECLSQKLQSQLLCWTGLVGQYYLSSRGMVFETWRRHHLLDCLCMTYGVYPAAK